MNLASRWKRGLFGLGVVAVLAALSALVLWPLLRTDLWPPSHENARYAILFDHFKEAFLQGQWYPRWLPNLNGGYGYPTFVFYQPGFFFFSLPFCLLPGYPVVTFKAVTWALFLIGSGGTYLLGREIADRKTSLLCAVLFLLTPYLYVELYVRNDLSELAAMVECPWVLLLAFRVSRRVREGASAAPSMVGLAGVLACTIVTHPAVALFGVPIFALVSAYRAWDAPPRARIAALLRLALSFLAGLVASAPYWLTVFRMQQFVDPGALSSGYYEASKHVVYWPQFLANSWGFGGSNAGGDSDGMPLQLGAPHCALSLIGLVSGWRSRAIRGAFAAYLFLILLMSPWSEWFWSLPVTSIRQVQFPWRLLAVTATLQATCAAGLGRLWRRWAVVLGVLLPMLIWYRQEFYPNPGGGSLEAEVAHQRSQDTLAWQRYANVNEFIPRTSRHDPPRPRGSEPLLVAGPGTRVTASKKSTASRLRYRIEADVPSEATLNQLYLPGWRVVLDGEVLPRQTLEARLTEDGRMRVGLAPGAHELEAYYDGPPGWRGRTVACGIALAGFLTFCYVDWRKRRLAVKSATSPPDLVGSPSSEGEEGAVRVEPAPPRSTASEGWLVRRWQIIAAVSGMLAVALFAFLATTPAGHGWRSRRFDNPKFQGQPVEEGIVSEPFVRDEAGPPFSAEWESSVRIDQTGQYEFTLNVDDQGELWIDGKRLIWAPGVHPRSPFKGELRLSAGLHFFRIRLADFGGGRYLRLFVNRLDAAHGWFPVPFPRWMAWPGPPPPAAKELRLAAPARTWLFGAVLLLASLCVASLLRSSARRGGRPVLSRGDCTIAAAVLVFALGVRAVHLHDVDIHWDEGAYLKAGQQFVRNVMLGDLIPKSFEWNNEHPPIAKWMYGVAELAGGMRGAKLLAGFLEALTCLFLFLLGRRFVSRWVGIGAAAVLALSPYFVAHGRITGLEAPSAFFFTLSAYLLAIACSEGSRYHHFAWAFVSVLGIGARATGVWFGPVALVVCLVAFIRGSRRLSVFLPAFGGAIAGLAVIYVAWPWIWTDPIAQMKITYSHWAAFHPYEYFFGVLRPLPAGYYAFAFLAVNPIGLLALALVWCVAAARRRSLVDWLVAAWLVFPFGQSLSPMKQDGARYVIQAFPALAFAAAWGADTAAQWTRRAWARPATHALVAGYLGVLVYLAHPYELDYFSEWTGGTAAVARRKWMEVPIWGEGQTEAARFINSVARPGARVFIQVMPHDDFPGLREDLVMSDFAHAEYVLVDFFQFRAPPGGCRVLHEVKAGGAVIAAIYEKI